MTGSAPSAPLRDARLRLERELGIGTVGCGHTGAEWAMLWLAYSNLVLVEHLARTAAEGEGR